jgi:U3 small nucleolar RNA-associated protein 20
LVVALARDLQQEFYPHYPEFVHNLISLLDTKDSDVVEWTCICFALLSMFLWRYLVKDFRIVFNELLPLLKDSIPDSINNFAAESFAFVARKVKDKRAFLLLVLKTLKKPREVRTYFLCYLQRFFVKIRGVFIYIYMYIINVIFYGGVLFTVAVLCVPLYV